MFPPFSADKKKNRIEYRIPQMTFQDGRPDMTSEGQKISREVIGPVIFILLVWLCGLYYGALHVLKSCRALSSCCVIPFDHLGVGLCASHAFEPRHDKINKMAVRPAKTQISLGIRPVWSESSLSACRKLGCSATHWAHSEDSDKTGRMPRLFLVFAGRTVTLLVLSCRGSFVCLFCTY